MVASTIAKGGAGGGAGAAHAHALATAATVRRSRWDGIREMVCRLGL
jgi:hypothetical protein